MVRRHVATLALAAMLVLVGCGSSASAPTAWRTPPPAASGAGAGGGSVVTPSQASSPPSARPRVSASPSRTPSSPRPSSTKAQPSNPVYPGGHGPFGSISNTGSSAVALTFDDGPGRYTNQILDQLKRAGIHATFCVIGRQVAGYPAVIKRIVNEGHTLCNHTWSHDEQLNTRTPEQITAELQRTNDAIHAIVPNARIVYFRNPGGNFSPETISIAAAMGMKSLYWSVDPRDWANPGTQAIIDNVLNHTHSGSIVLMHDGGGDRSQTVAALQTVLPTLKRRYTLIPLPTGGSSG